MTVTITFAMVAWAIGLGLAWTAFLLGAIKWLLNRQITALDAKLTEADKKATKAATDLAAHEKVVADNLANMRLEFSQKNICQNHTRMEANDKDLFVRLDSLHGDIRELVGGVKSLTNSIDLINQHLLNGGK